MSDNLKKMIDTIPKVYNPSFNPVILALITALAQSDDEIQRQIAVAKEQNFVRTATGQNLDKIANSLGVSRPQSLGLSDTDYQELIPNLSLKPKQIKKAFYDTADIFWGPLFSRANVTTNNVGPYNVSTGDIFSVKIDSGDQQNIKALTGDIAVNGSATAEEIVAILSRVKGVTVSILEDSLSGLKRVNLRTNTPGSVGSIQFLASSMIGSSKLDFALGEYDILNLPQRVSVYNLAPNELLIEIPSIVPSLRRTLRGSHHFHLDGTVIGVSGPLTFASATIQDLVFTARTAGAVGNTISVLVTMVGFSGSPVASVAGNVITITANQSTTTQQIKNAVAANPAADALVSVDGNFAAFYGQPDEGNCINQVDDGFPPANDPSGIDGYTLCHLAFDQTPVPLTGGHDHWSGSFLFNPSGSGGPFTVTSQKAVLQETITKGDVHTSLTVDSTALIQNPAGFLMMNFGKGTQEVPIRYRGVPNSNTILIDPSYVWKNSHSIGETINIVSDLSPYTPKKNGQDLSIYFTSPSGAREVVQDILTTLQAAGIIIHFLILAPKYKYLLDNPYISSDDAPSA